MSESITEVTYRSGTAYGHEDWDVMHMIYRNRAKNESASCVVARTPDGKILQRTDVLLDLWKEISEPEDLKFFQSQFRERNRLRAEQAESAGA